MNQLKLQKLILFNLILILLTILFCHASFSFFLIIDLCYLIPAVIVQILNPITELVISIRIPIKEAKAEIKTHPVIVEAKIRKCPI